MLTHVTLERRGVVDALSLLVLVEGIIVNLLTSKLILMEHICLFTLVIVHLVCASALGQMRLGKVELRLVRILHLEQLLGAHLKVRRLLEGVRGAYLCHEAWMEACIS